MATATLRDLDGVLAVVIPGALLTRLGLKAGVTLEIATDGSRILLQPSGPARPR